MLTFPRLIQLTLLAAAVAMSSAIAAAADATIPLAKLGWLAGTWQFTKGDRMVTEIWMPPEGKTMLGAGRTVVAGATREYEFLLLREEGERITYTARPSGQQEATFVLTRATDTEAVFENAAHDFPQRISYRLNPDGTLLAVIEGATPQGKIRRVEFPYRRAQ